MRARVRVRARVRARARVRVRVRAGVGVRPDLGRLEVGAEAVEHSEAVLVALVVLPAGRRAARRAAGLAAPWRRAWRLLLLARPAQDAPIDAVAERAARGRRHLLRVRVRLTVGGATCSGLGLGLPWAAPPAQGQGEA